MNTSLKALAVATVLVPFALIDSVSAKPISLRPGVYYGGGSRYITIVKKGNRYCYNGVSNNGESYVSLVPVPKHSNRYRMNAGKKILLMVCL